MQTGPPWASQVRSPELDRKKKKPNDPSSVSYLNEMSFMITFKVIHYRVIYKHIRDAYRF